MLRGLAILLVLAHASTLAASSIRHKCKKERGHHKLENNPCTKECGINTDCEVVENIVARCECKPGYGGDPKAGCKALCLSNGECLETEACLDNLCDDPCPTSCGDNTTCRVDKHRATCECKPGSGGDPDTGCKVICNTNEDCDRKKACIDKLCDDPCVNYCGNNTVCSVQDHEASCRCRFGFKGDPISGCEETIKIIYGDEDNLIMIHDIELNSTIHITTDKSIGTLRDINFNMGKQAVYIMTDSEMHRVYLDAKLWQLGYTRIIAYNMTRVKIGVDWLRDRYYWIDCMGLDNNYACIYSDLYNDHLNINSHQGFMYYVAIDPFARYIFLKNYRYIFKTGLYGSGTRILIKSNDSVDSLALDIRTRTIYFSEHYDGKCFISSCDYNGNQNKTIWETTWNNGLIYLVDYLDNSLYYITFNSGTNLWRLNLSKPNPSPVLVKKAKYMWPIKLYHSKMQPYSLPDIV